MPTEDDLGPRLSARLSFVLKRAFLELDALHQTRLAPYGIEARDMAVLLLLDSREPESQQQAARRLAVDRTTMVSLIDGLEAKGLVTRRPDTADRRRNVVELTDAGRATLTDALRASDEAEAELLATLDETEAAQFRDMLRRIALRNT